MDNKIRNEVRIAVENSPIGCTKWSPSEKMWEFKNGTISYFGEKQSEFGFTIILHRPASSTMIHLESMNEVIDTLANHEENWNKFVAEDKALADYLTSDEGAWGRQDSF